MGKQHASIDKVYKYRDGELTNSGAVLTASRDYVDKVVGLEELASAALKLKPTGLRSSIKNQVAKLARRGLYLTAVRRGSFYVIKKKIVWGKQTAKTAKSKPEKTVAPPKPTPTPTPAPKDSPVNLEDLDLDDEKTGRAVFAAWNALDREFFHYKSNAERQEKALRDTLRLVRGENVVVVREKAELKKTIESQRTHIRKLNRDVANLQSAAEDKKNLKTHRFSRRLTHSPASKAG